LICRRTRVTQTLRVGIVVVLCWSASARIDSLGFRYGVSVASKRHRRESERSAHSEYSAYLSRIERADERTRTANLTSLPVRSRPSLVLQRSTDSAYPQCFIFLVIPGVAGCFARVRVKLESETTRCRDLRRQHQVARWRQGWSNRSFLASAVARRAIIPLRLESWLHQVEENVQKPYRGLSEPFKILTRDG
jgi:hypothetical protein